MRKKVKTLIIGAGCGGLGAAVWLKHLGQDFMVVEANDSIPLNLHNGVHYLHNKPSLPFKSDFKEMTLTDGILVDGDIIHTPNLAYSLQYSEKVREIQHPSSIMDIGKRQEVFMPKSNTVNTLLTDMYDFADHDNFNFGYWLKIIDSNARAAHFEKNGEKLFVEYDNIISTIPLNVLAKMIPSNSFIESLTLASAPVYITNYKVNKIVPNWMINLYVPSLNTLVYRASILNGVCSVESISELNEAQQYEARALLSMFHLDTEKPTQFTWKTGKVLSISKDDRHQLVEELYKSSIYSIGRFGLWNRKLLIDTTIDQAYYVAKHINGTLYEEISDSLS